MGKDVHKMAVRPQIRVVSGCPRTGTSCMMLQHVGAFGEDAVLGVKFPTEFAYEQQTSCIGDETEMHRASRVYMQERTGVIKYDKEDSELMKDMNPHGFWECGASVKGLTWMPGIEKALEDKKVVKIVSIGLMQTDPSFVHSVVYMIRHPRQVAKSHEKIRRMWQFLSAKEERKIKIHTPVSFCDSAYAAALWFIAHPEVPVLMVNFDDMIAEPEKTLGRVSEFWGGDFAEHTIKKSLKRSEPEDIEHRLWLAAEAIWEMQLVEDHQGIIDFYKKYGAFIKREEINTTCFRAQQRVTVSQCLECRANVKYRQSLADQSKHDWRKEPCIFECVTDPDRKPEDLISIEDSINNNFWLEDNFYERRATRIDKIGHGEWEDHPSDGFGKLLDDTGGNECRDDSADTPPTV